MSSLDEILELTNYDQFSKQEKWSLIDKLDLHTDALQYWQQLAPPDSSTRKDMAQLLIKVRRKRLDVWQSLYPSFSHTIRVAA